MRNVNIWIKYIYNFTVTYCWHSTPDIICWIFFAYKNEQKKAFRKLMKPVRYLSQWQVQCTLERSISARKLICSHFINKTFAQTLIVNWLIIQIKVKRNISTLIIHLSKLQTYCGKAANIASWTSTKKCQKMWNSIKKLISCRYPHINYVLFYLVIKNNFYSMIALICWIFHCKSIACFIFCK